jgi:hypothetical protein
VRNRRFVAPAVVVAIVLALVGARFFDLERFRSADAVTIAVVYDPDENGDAPQVLSAYQNGLTDEGIPFTPVSISGQLLLLTGAQLAARFPALILADGVNRRASAALARRLQEYVAAGGSLVIVDDAASQDRLGHYLGHGRLIDLAGVDYVRYGVLGTQSYVTGSIAFRDETTARAWNVPPGALNGVVLSSPTYGHLRYPLPASRVIASGVEVVASDGAIPVITVRRIGPSTIVFVGLPLGYLLARGDRAPFQATMRTFTRQFVPLPYLDAGKSSTYVFRRAGRDVEVELHNRPSLNGVGFAIPQKWLLGGTVPPSVRDTGIRDGYHYFNCVTTAQDLLLRFPARLE